MSPSRRVAPPPPPMPSPAIGTGLAGTAETAQRCAGRGGLLRVRRGSANYQNVCTGSRGSQGGLQPLLEMLASRDVGCGCVLPETQGTPMLRNSSDLNTVRMRLETFCRTALLGRLTHYPKFSNIFLIRRPVAPAVMGPRQWACARQIPQVLGKS
jgi:hypothetical protein